MRRWAAILHITPRIVAARSGVDYSDLLCQFEFMRKQDIKIGALYDWGGYVVEVIAIEPDGIVIECQEVGQDIVKPSSLKEIVPMTSEPVFYEG